MATFDWLYSRKGCTTCAKATDFLDKNQVEADEIMDARKDRIGPREALALASMVDEIYVAKGKKVVHFDLRTERPSDQELTALIIGPTGNLRAPSARRGRKLIVGFDPDTYKKVLVS
jgi:arsenate reductase-like glutaredoxin family protein